MSFYSSLLFYRPGPPPIVSGKGLAAFLRAFEVLKVSDVSYPRTLEVRFDGPIDKDEKPASWGELVEPGLYESREIEWDLRVQCRSIGEMAVAIGSDRRPIYRAELDLGNPLASIFESLAVDSPENAHGFAPDTWGMTTGPTECHDLGGETSLFVGWMNVRLHGNGYLYPCTLAELVARAQSNPDLARVTDLCRETWPVDMGLVTERHAAMRKQAGELWPYPSLDMAWDWYWGLQES